MLVRQQTHCGIARPMVVVLLLLCPGATARGQQVTIGVPEQSISDSYYEYIGASGEYYGPGLALRFGPQPPPGFGGFAPDGGLTGGFAFGSGGRFGRMNFSALAGRSTVYSSTTPYLTVTNGMPGHLFVGRMTPFVTGVIPTTPLVGPPAVDPNFASLGAANSIAGRIQRGEMHLRDGRIVPGPDPQLMMSPDLAGIGVPRDGRPLKHFDAAVQLLADLDAAEPAAAGQAPPLSSEAARLFRKGLQLEAEGKPGAAKLLYQSALRTADAALRPEITARLQALTAARGP